VISFFGKRLGRLWASISFRLTLNYGLLATLTTLVLITFIYFQFMSALRTLEYRQIEQSGQRLVVVFEEGDREELITAINLTLSDRIDSEREFYLLLDEHGNRLAGNLDSLPDDAIWHLGIREVKILQDNKEALGHLKKIQLSDGSLLIVGHDTRDMDDVASLAMSSVLAVIFFAIALIALGSYIFRRELEYRIADIRRVTEKIGTGQLSQRIELSGVDDEFSYLHRDINAMLDRIEALMKGVRHVSDTIAHNLRTPLMRVLNRLRTAQSPGKSAEEVLEATRYAIDEIDNLNALFGKLLHIAEMETGVQRQAFRPCRLDTIAHDVVEMYEAYAEELGLTLTLATPTKAWVHSDPDLIASALANVLDNAIKYASSAVHLTVSGTKPGYACITVRDDGPGVPAHETRHLGRHFHRINASSPGHGLGLASVLAIVRLHDGQLLFSDAEPGLLVTICLPLANHFASPTAP